MDNGQLVTSVEVMGDGSTFGSGWSVPSVPKPTSSATATQISDAVQNLIAWCATAYGRPVIVGFSRPRTGIAPKEQDRKLDVHDASGGYVTFAPDGTYEVFIPGGGYLRIGTGAHAAVPLAAGALKAAGPPNITVTLATAHGTLTLDPIGNWTLTGAHLQVNCDVDVNGSLSTTGNLIAGTGATGNFTTPAGQTVMVQDGIITNIY
jgi:hypothetical protein